MHTFLSRGFKLGQACARQYVQRRREGGSLAAAQPQRGDDCGQARRRGVAGEGRRHGRELAGLVGLRRGVHRKCLGADFYLGAAPRGLRRALVSFSQVLDLGRRVKFRSFRGPHRL